MTSRFDWADRRVLVTGGAGLVGSYLVQQLVDAGAQVRVADNLTRGRLDNLDAVLERIELVDVDLLDAASARKACAGQQVVFNLAAKVAGAEYNRTHHAEMLSINFQLAASVLGAAVAQGVERFLVVSSACVYPQDSPVPTAESAADRGGPEPANVGYGWAKRMAEGLGASYGDDGRLDVAIVRPFNAYGPRERFEGSASHVIPSLLGRVLGGEDPLVVWGSGRQTRSFLHASDLATGMRKVCESGVGAGPVNVASAEEITIADLVRLVCRLTGLDPTIEFDTTRPEGHLRRAADLTKLKQVTGWIPTVTLEAGLAETAEAYRRWMAEREPLPR
jgi:nucleoside-diphosphate-sugar epimerase